MKKLIIIALVMAMGASVAFAAGISKQALQADLSALPANLQQVIAQSLGIQQEGRAGEETMTLAERIANDPASEGEANADGPMHVSMVAPLYYDASLVRRILEDLTADPGDMVFETIKSIARVADDKWKVETKSCRVIYDVRYVPRDTPGPIGGGRSTEIKRNAEASECHRPTLNEYRDCGSRYTCIQGSAYPEWNWDAKAYECKCPTVNPALPQ